MSTSLNSTKPCEQDHPQLTHRRTTAHSNVARGCVGFKLFGTEFLNLIFFISIIISFEVVEIRYLERILCVQFWRD